MKKTLLIAVAVMLVCVLAACTGVNGTATDGTAAPGDGTQTTTTVPDDGTAALRLEAYSNALTTLINEHMLPNDNDCGYDDIGPMSNNSFSLFDIDGDGRDELIITYITTYMAGMSISVYDYDAQTGKLYEELNIYPSASFYSNGAVWAQLSHNQGKAGDMFWPSMMFLYDPATDTYKLDMMVDAWSRDFEPEGYPEEADTSNFGMVMYLMPDGEYDTSNPVDVNVYSDWLKAALEGAEQLEYTETPLTAENAAAIVSR